MTRRLVIYLKEQTGYRNFDVLFFFIFLRSTNDDVDVLKCELISIQKHMYEVLVEKDQQIEKLYFTLAEKFVIY